MEVPSILRQLGFSDKEIQVYLTLLTSGPTSVRKLAKDADLNRGTVYDALKSLQDRGVVGVFQKHRRQFFMAEDPEKFGDVIEQQERTITSLKRNFTEVLPELRSLYVHGGTKPVVKYYEGAKGINLILRDVLKTVDELDPKFYRIYSSLAVRSYVYNEFPHFTKERIAREIHVNVIALGKGGAERPYSDRRWLTQEAIAPTYTIIYGPKVAHITLDKGDVPLGVLIEDERIADAERIIFDHVWSTLDPKRPSFDENTKDGPGGG